MAQFYSDLLTWTTVSVAGAAVALSGLEFHDRPQSEGSGGPLLLAVASDAQADEFVRQVVAETTAAEATAAGRSVAQPSAARTQPMPQIREAVLEEVVFTATGDTSALDLPASVSSRNTGRVTGETVNLRAGPGTSFAVVGRGKQGDDLSVTGKTDGVWVQVLLPISEAEAWIHGRYFEAPQG